MKRKINGKGKGNPNPSPATRFKAGNRFVGQGKRKIPNSELIRYTAEVIAETIKELHALTFPELKEISQSNEVPSLKRTIARGMVTDIQSGSLYNFDRLLARSIGNVPTKQELSGLNGIPLVPPQIVIQEVEPNREEALKPNDNPSTTQG